MRFHIGAFPESSDFKPDDSWKEIRQLGPVFTQLVSLPLGIIAGGIITVLWLYFTPVTKQPFFSSPLMLGSMFLLFPVHEFIHALAHPQFGMSGKTIFGMWPTRGLCYVCYDGTLSSNRLIVILAMPLLVISVFPLLISAVMGRASLTIAFISALNAFGACIDIFAICWLLLKIPRAAVMRGSGMKAYWKPCEK